MQEYVSDKLKSNAQLPKLLKNKQKSIESIIYRVYAPKSFDRIIGKYGCRKSTINTLEN
jgi:hypothetical protein